MSLQGGVEDGFEGRFGDVEAGTVALVGQRPAVGPNGVQMWAWGLEASNGSASHLVLMDRETGEPLGHWNGSFRHVMPGALGVYEYPFFLGVKGLQAELNTGDSLWHLGMEFQVVGVDPLVMSLQSETPFGSATVLYQVDGSLDAMTIERDGMIVWRHAGFEAPLVDRPEQTRYQGAVLERGPGGMVPPGGDFPFSLEDAVDGLRSNEDAAAFLERHPEAVVTRAHFDSDAAVTADTVYRYRWQITIGGDGERLVARVSALADSTGGAVPMSEMIESLEFEEAPGGLPKQESMDVVTIASVYEQCSTGVSVGLVELDYVWFGGSHGIVTGGLPSSGGSMWACGIVFFGTTWDAVNGYRILTPGT